jgi:hypothetical protein
MSAKIMTQAKSQAIQARPDFEGDDQSTRSHRQMIGYLGLLLVPAVVVLAGIRPSTGIGDPWAILPSISAYYYTGGTAVFVGVLCALSVFLFTYQGYDNEKNVTDRATAMFGGLAAAVVALFPAAAPEGVDELLWWTRATGAIHYVAAALLLGSFAVFCLWLFPRSHRGQWRAFAELDAVKQARNTVYLVCGLAIVGSLIWAGSSIWTNAPIFLPECIALLAFAAAWLVKGRLDRTIAEMPAALGKAFGRLSVQKD